MIKKLFSAATALVCCASAFPFAAFAEDPEFTQKDITAHVYSQDNVKSLSSRFYSDLPAVPYVRLNDYYQLLLGKELKVDADGAVFTLTNPLGQTAKIDTDTDLLTSDDFSEFINTTIYRQDNVYNVYYDGMPFVRVADTDFDGAAVSTSIDFSGYGIDLRSDEGELWVPFITANDIFKSVTMISSFYDGEEYYFVDDNSDYNSMETSWSKEFCTKAVGCFFKDGKRSPETAKFSYGELCFAIDTFYGMSGQAMIKETLNNTSSFDKAIEELDEKADGLLGLKDLLLSESGELYDAGLYLLDLLFFDGGHMGFDMTCSMLKNALGISDEVMIEAASVTGYDLDEASGRKNARLELDKAVNEAREKAIGKEKYRKEGNTAFYCFDSFMASREDWEKYYAGKGERPQDELGGLLDAMKKADEDPEVKNFIIDLSCNGGGSGDLVVTIMRLISGNSYINFLNTISEQYVNTEYDIDANFDGVFDEKDDEKQYDLNFGVLISEYAFSCGNLLPALCKDCDIPLFGDKSGGGACAVYMCITPDGLPYRMSSSVHLVDKDGKSIDAGIEPDYQMLKRAEDGSCNYAELYDFAFINEKMNELYPAEDESRPEEESKPAESEVSSQEEKDGTNPATGAAYAGAAFAVVILAGAVAAGRRKQK
ncbi:Peptidase family S41 [Ruminococcaceae bacterium FB2012]|nr:Peptidase family S41 [Ruminococcaceae bacterium FB2012]